MNPPIPFLRPKLVPIDAFMPYLRTTEQTRLYSNFGPLITKFEQRMVAEWFAGEGHVCTIGNATLGLMLAISQHKRAGRYAIMPSFTFAATALAAQWCGLEPVFVDVDPEQWAVTPEALERALAKYGDEVAVVVPYATCGSCIDLAPYEKLVKAGVPVVVDAASSIGSVYDGRAFGQGFPGVVVYSLHATKTFPVGEGCLVHSSNADLIARIKRACNFGFGSARESTMLGMNAKMPEMLGAVALATLDTFSARRKVHVELHARYMDLFRRSGLINAGFRPQKLRGVVSPQWFAVAAPDKATQERVVKDAAARGIELRRYFTPPCHVQQQFAKAPHDGLAFTRQLSDVVLSLPLWLEMTDAEVARVIDSLCASVGLKAAVPG